MKPRRKQREYLIDKLNSLHRKPTAAPTVEADVAISMALTCFVPGPASDISPSGRGVFLIKRALRQAGYSIVPTEAKREDNG